MKKTTLKMNLKIIQNEGEKTTLKNEFENNLKIKNTKIIKKTNK